MNRDDIIRMADEAGITPWEKLEYIGGKRFSSTDEGLDGDLACLIQFATLVAAHEREECAKLCESLPIEWEDQPNIAQAELATMMDCALAIREREKNEPR